MFTKKELETLKTTRKTLVASVNKKEMNKQTALRLYKTLIYKLQQRKNLANVHYTIKDLIC